MAARIDRDDLDVDANSVLVLKMSGPLGGPGFPEWGMLPMPKKLIKQGIKDMVRISDARLAFGDVFAAWVQGDGFDFHGVSPGGMKKINMLKVCVFYLILSNMFFWVY